MTRSHRETVSRFDFNRTFQSQAFIIAAVTCAIDHFRALKGCVQEGVAASDGDLLKNRSAQCYFDTLTTCLPEVLEIAETRLGRSNEKDVVRVLSEKVTTTPVHALLRTAPNSSLHS